MDQEQLNAIKERVAKATAGVWRSMDTGHIRTRYSVGNEEEYVAHTYDVNDAEFIAHSRDDVPALVAEVEHLKNQPIIKHICNASFVDEYPLSAILESGKTLSEGSLFTVGGIEYLVLNIVIRSATELLVETKRV